MGIYELRIPANIFKLVEYMDNARAYILVIEKDRKDGIAFAVRSSDTVFVISKYTIDNARHIYSITSPIMKIPIHITPDSGQIIIQLNEDEKTARILHFDKDSRTPILVRRVLKHNTHTILIDATIVSEKLANVIYMNSNVLQDVSFIMPRIEVIFDEVHIRSITLQNRYYMYITLESDYVSLSIKVPVYESFTADHVISVEQFIMMYKLMPTMFNLDDKSLYFYKEIGDLTAMLRLRCKHG